MTRTVVVSNRGADRWRLGHPWIYRSDVEACSEPPGVVRVEDHRGRFIGSALWSPASEIRVRMLTGEADPIDADWWRRRIRAARDRRAAAGFDATAYRVVHGEGDGLPALVVDRYGPYVVAQILSAGLEAVRDQVLEGLMAELEPEGLLLRNDASVRRHEGLPLGVECVAGTVPDLVEVREGPLHFHAALRHGQKTGAFLDQRDNRRLAASLATGRALDVFTYHGLFALHMAARANHVIGVDSSAPALEVARTAQERNGVANVDWVAANAFEYLRQLDRDGTRFDVIVLDPPAFAKRRNAVRRALAGYKEINLRALKLLAPGGRLLTFSCSYHVDRAAFLGMLVAAAQDAGRRVVLEQVLCQAQDHPEVLTIPETGYLKGAVVRAE